MSVRKSWKASEEPYGKDTRVKMYSTGNIFLTKHVISAQEAVIRVLLSLAMRHSNVDAFFVPSSIKMNRTRLLKSL